MRTSGSDFACVFGNIGNSTEQRKESDEARCTKVGSI
jgi:hypothetical protein